MPQPTVYKVPKKSIVAKKPTENTKRIWANHRKKINKSTELPPQKN